MTAEVKARAEAILRDRLTPAQCEDVELTGWFNVRDANGSLWRIQAVGVYSPGGEVPNITDDTGQGRTMFAKVPIADIALSLLLYFTDPELSLDVAHRACISHAPRTPSPRELEAHYKRFNEDVGGGPARKKRRLRR